MLRLVLGVFIVPALWAQASGPGFQDWQDRWNHYVARTYSWERVGWLTADTTTDLLFRFDKCGRPPYCFPHHLGGAFLRRTARTTIELGAGALFNEDVRRRPSGLTGFRKRASFALTHAMLAQNSEKEWRPSYARFTGTFGGIVVSRAWRQRPITSGRLFQEFGWSTTTYFQDALMAEFEPDMRREARRLFTNITSASKRLFTADR